MFPNFVQVHWIGQDEDIKLLDLLLNEKFIGVDSEWRPELT